MGVSIDSCDGLRYLHFSFSIQPPRVKKDMSFASRILVLVKKFAKPVHNTPAQYLVTPAGVEHFLFLLQPKP